MPETARTFENPLTGKTEMNFDVLLWSLEVQESVFRYIQATVNSAVVKERIELMPMEKIRITWKDSTNPISGDFRLADTWQPNTHLPSKVTFKFTCRLADKCKSLQEDMVCSPHFFNDLVLQYTIDGQKSARRTVSVTGKHILQGRLFTQMLNTLPPDQEQV